MDVRKHASASDGHGAEELVELFVVAHGQLDVARNDAGLFVVAGSIASELKDLSGEVLENRRKVNWGTSTNTGGVLALLEVAADAANWELESRLGRLGGRLGSGLASATAALAALSFA